MRPLRPTQPPTEESGEPENYRRPEGLLVAGARAACSGWSFVDPPQADEYTAALRAAIDAGEWDAKYGTQRQQPTMTAHW